MPHETPKMPRRAHWILIGLMVGAGVSACGGEDPFPSDAELTQIVGLYRVSTPDQDTTNAYADDAAARTLGAKLFNDKGVSSCGTISCASCHPAPAYTVDTAHAQGCNGKTPHNPPTLLNVSFDEWFFWDGHKDSLWSQALGPLMNPIEMAQTPAVRPSSPSRTTSSSGTTVTAFS